ncbi:TPA: hypothetical protein DIS57_01475 [Candidatus Wolfebacteria bacterium]|nr:hypothetical protein [Candidatus Wolfebacteria bacterium]HBT74516.1 hypothetical protein [Candidatus Wolfebacteria bacterium]HCM52610.1 hypothetical protein [Candidatus Wolfebacteria bacterium]
MAKRLRLPILMPSILRATFFGGTLTLAVINGGFFWASLFFAAAFSGYFRSLFEWNTFLYSFFVLTLYAYLGTSFLMSTSEVGGASGNMPVVLASMVFGTLFFLLLGIKEFLFLWRHAIFNFLSGALYFFIGGTFFIVDKSAAGDFLLYFLLSFVALYLLIRESIEFFMEDAPKRKKELLVIGSAVLVAEFLSVVSILPIGFLNSAALIILFVFILEDLVYYHLKGTLDRQIVLNNMTILIVCLLFIFATSKLSL